METTTLSKMETTTPTKMETTTLSKMGTTIPARMETTIPIPEFIFRPYEAGDYEGLKNVMQECYSDLGSPYAPEEEMVLLNALYPRGQIVCLCDGVLVGATISRIVPSSIYFKAHTQAEIINLEVYEQDAVNGDSLYGMDVFVSAPFQRFKIGKQLVFLLHKVAVADNFYCNMGNSRIPNYAAYAQTMSLQEYALKVKNRELVDAALSFHYSNGYSYISDNPNFCEDDVKSAGHGINIAVLNPTFNSNLPIYPDRAANLAKLNASKNTQ